jgi:hypothetical protein
MFLFHLFTAIGAANAACGVQISPPQVTLGPGPLQFTIGGGLFASDIGLLIACAPAVIGAPLVSKQSESALAAARTIELMVGWRRAIAEQRKIGFEASRSEAERRLTEINIEIRKLELERAHRKHTSSWIEAEVRGRYWGSGSGLEIAISPPESSEVRRDLVQEQARRFAMTEVYANHLLNRTLPSLRLLKQKMAGIDICVIEPIAHANRKASATHLLEIVAHSLTNEPSERSDSPPKES